MLDVLNLPKPQNGYIDYFFGDAATAATSWRIWEKPRGISMIHITCFGGGSGGGGGILTNQSGGGGGGSGGQTTLLIPAHVLPDILYVSVGRGGAGASVFNTIGSSGTASYVSIAPSTAAFYAACFANGSVAGGNGSTGNSGGVAATQANALMSSQGFFFALAGQSGQSSGGAVITYPTTRLLLSGGGCGGAGSSFLATGFGGRITAPTQSSITFFSNIPGGTDGTNIPGSNGISLFQPLLSTGGAGGGGQGATGIALNGSGGNGGFGSGGGGVGNAGGFINAGTSAGKGGDGLVIIQCF